MGALRRLTIGLVTLCMALSLAGCAAPKLTLDPEELYALPELPERYTALNQQLSAIQEGGAEYATPVSGSNIQPVQMMDLDGDGREEALAFFRQQEGRMHRALQCQRHSRSRRAHHTLHNNQHRQQHLRQSENRQRRCDQCRRRRECPPQRRYGRFPHCLFEKR